MSRQQPTDPLLRGAHLERGHDGDLAVHQLLLQSLSELGLSRTAVIDVAGWLLDNLNNDDADVEPSAFRRHLDDEGMTL